MTDPSILNALVKDSFIEAYKVSGVDVDPTTIIVPVNPRYAFITKIHKKLRKYSKRIGKRQALKWAMFTGSKLFDKLKSYHILIECVNITKAPVASANAALLWYKQQDKKALSELIHLYS